MAFSMTDDEIRTKIRNGTPIKIIAELNGVTDQTIYNWMRKNNIERPGAKVTPEEVKQAFSEPAKIEVCKKTFDDVGEALQTLKFEIEACEEKIKMLNEEIDSWNKIKALLTVKEAKDDVTNKIPFPHQL